MKKKVLALGLLALSMAACTNETADPASPAVAVCDGVEPAKIALNGKDLNGIHNNGYSLNGIQGNGIQGNGIQGNGIQGNGAALSHITLDGAAVVGASLRGAFADGTSIALVIASERDGRFEVTYEGTNVCAGDGRGVFVPGVWDERGARHDSPLATFACPTGALAKCVLMGYDPARVGSAMHQACTRMVRADYCGDGVSSTRDGTSIDVFDTRGVQTSAHDPDFAFEAGWNENGATCVSRPRFASAVPTCWNDLPTCGSADEATTRGASLMNASRPTCR